jgi:hypothetical protein
MIDFVVYIEILVNDANKREEGNGRLLQESPKTLGQISDTSE